MLSSYRCWAPSRVELVQVLSSFKCWARSENWARVVKKAQRGTNRASAPPRDSQLVSNLKDSHRRFSNSISIQLITRSILDKFSHCVHLCWWHGCNQISVTLESWTHSLFEYRSLVDFEIRNERKSHKIAYVNSKYCKTDFYIYKTDLIKSLWNLKHRRRYTRWRQD